MRVLVTNDDGIASPGLTVLADAALAAGHEVAVVAPFRQYSGASAALTSVEADGQLVFVEERPPGLDPSVRAVGVKAAPGLIGFVASSGAFGMVPDIVLSGVNLGANTGKAILHFGDRGRGAVRRCARMQGDGGVDRLGRTAALGQRAAGRRPCARVAGGDGHG